MLRSDYSGAIISQDAFAVDADFVIELHQLYTKMK